MSITIEEPTDNDIDIDDAIDIDIDDIQRVDPSWFVSPAQRIRTSGGTAPFFKLVLTQDGIDAMKSRSRGLHNNNMEQQQPQNNYWIGKDLSHAQDEKDFYAEILRIRSNTTNQNKDLTHGVGLLEPFMFDYLGILRTKTNDDDEDSHCDLLVLANLRTNCQWYRMMDLKIGEKTACGGWKGKSHFRAIKHHFMDGLTNSILEGYRLCGFNGCPQVIDSMDPLLDILADDSIQKNASAFGKQKSRLELMLERQSIYPEQPSMMRRRKSALEQILEQQHHVKTVWDENIKGHHNVKDYVKTMWGSKIKKSQVQQVEKHMFKRMNGTNAFRYFFDLRRRRENPDTNRLLPIEVAEIVAHEFTSQLIRLSTLCHKVKIPQKWIGSSVAVAYDAGYFPNRSSISETETEVRSKVLCRIFDWGRSELLTHDRYQELTARQKRDRDRFWELYKKGIDRLSYNATRFYYHQFTTSTRWTQITIELWDFSSLSTDSLIGSVRIELPDPSDKRALFSLSEAKSYKIQNGTTLEATLECSLTYIELPSSSRLKGTWRVVIHRAKHLPPMVPLLNTCTTNAYCLVKATNNSNSSSTLQNHNEFVQQTCIQARTLDPEFRETIDVPICKHDDVLASLLKANGIAHLPTIEDFPDFFEWDSNDPNEEIMKLWAMALEGKELSTTLRDQTSETSFLDRAKNKATILFRPQQKEDEAKKAPPKWQNPWSFVNKKRTR